MLASPRRTLPMNYNTDISHNNRYPSLPNQNMLENNRVLLQSELHSQHSIQNSITNNNAAAPISSHNQQLNVLQPSEIELKEAERRVKDLDDRIDKDYQWLRCWYYIQVIFFCTNGIYKVITGYPVIHQTVALLYLIFMYGSGIQGMRNKDLAKAQCSYIMISVIMVFLVLAIILSIIAAIKGPSDGEMNEDKMHPFLSSLNSLPMPLVVVFSSCLIVFYVTNLMPARRIRDILKERRRNNINGVNINKYKQHKLQ